MALVWWALGGQEEHERPERVDWVGAASLAATLIALNLALLGNAEIQSVSGLDELQGGSGFDFRLLFPVALCLGAVFVWNQRRVADPLVEPAFFRGATLRVALLVNFLVGAALVIAMVDVPIFINAVELDLERSAVIAGWILAALTSAMAIASWVGGRITERVSYRGPIVVGLLAAVTLCSSWGSPGIQTSGTGRQRHSWPSSGRASVWSSLPPQLRSSTHRLRISGVVPQPLSWWSV